MTSRTGVAAIIHHTLLKPEATPADVAALVDEAKDLGVLAICVSPSMLPIADPGELVVATVVGFPSGQVKPEIKAAEAKRAVADGAAEVDMVINVGSAIAGAFDAVEADIRGVVEATGSSLVKVIIESAALTDEQIVEVCRRAEPAGAGLVKTATGCHPPGAGRSH